MVGVGCFLERERGGGGEVRLRGISSGFSLPRGSRAIVRR